MCKDKWNSLNSDYKKHAIYHKGTRNHICFWDLSFDEKEKFHLPHQFNRKFYELIEEFQGENNVIAPLHVRDVKVENNGVHGQIPTMLENRMRMKISNGNTRNASFH
jgi:hypothetical protein